MKPSISANYDSFIDYHKNAKYNLILCHDCYQKVENEFRNIRVYTKSDSIEVNHKKLVKLLSHKYDLCLIN